MTARLLLLCPGQGGQHADMFALAQQGAAGAALLARLATMLPQAAAHLPAPSLTPDWHANRHAQPLVVAATLAMWAALADTAPPPALVAGYSVGELSAWSVAGACDPFDAVALAIRRSALMDQCMASVPAVAEGRAAASAAGSAMLAFSGLSCPRAAALALPLGGYLAIRNGADSGVLGLPPAHAALLPPLLAQHGARVTCLPVSVAAHTPHMAGALQPFGQVLAASRLGDASCPVLSGVSAERLTRRAQAIEHLPRQLAHMIAWDACMDAASEAGITVALELGPGNALARMMQARHPHLACRSVADFRSLDGIRAWLARHG